MRHRDGQVHEKWLCLVVFDKIERGIHHIQMRMAQGVNGLNHRFFVFDGPQIVGEKMVCMNVVGVAQKLIPPLFFGRASVVGLPQAPFAKHPCVVAVLLEILRNGKVFIAERYLAIAPNVGVSHVFARHQGTARGGAHRTSRVVIGISNTLFGHLVEMGRLEFLLPVAAQIPIAQIVGHDINDVGFGGGWGIFKPNDAYCEKEGDNQWIFHAIEIRGLFAIPWILI